MRIAVIGATGRTGRQVVEQALSRGHHVTALARQPDATSLRDERLVTAATDVLNRVAVLDRLAGLDAVVSTLGVGTSRAPTVLYSRGIANVLNAMDAHAIRKLAVISAAPVGPRTEQPFLERRVAMPILERLFSATYYDMRRMETLLRSSDVDWVSLRPPRLVNKKATGSYRLNANRPLSKARSLTYGDLATALLDSLDREDLYRQAAFVAN
ncbi:MAG: NAD(P)H-binding protein [Actinomycetota bacterium]|nr:NAD(P)H-binding protein [Actinomycetota bacterium]